MTSKEYLRIEIARTRAKMLHYKENFKGTGWRVFKAELDTLKEQLTKIKNKEKA